MNKPIKAIVYDRIRQSMIVNEQVEYKVWNDLPIGLDGEFGMISIIMVFLYEQE
jgi:hypothetical protein